MSYIRLVNVTKRFGNVTAVDNLNLEIGKGESFSMLGPSGCGKTTLLRLLKPQAAPHGTKTGEIFFCSENIEKCSEEDTAFNGA